MKMKITFADPKDSNELEFTIDEKRYFYLLMEIPAFQAVVAEVRDACKIPSEGINKNLTKFREIDGKRLLNLALLLTIKLNLTLNWMTTITALLLGTPLIKHKITLPPISSQSREDNKVIITVNERLSPTELATLIRKNTVLRDQLKALPTRKIKTNRKNLTRDMHLLKIQMISTKYSSKGIPRRDTKLSNRIMDKVDQGGELFNGIGHKEFDTNVSRVRGYLSKLFPHEDLLTHIVLQDPIEKLLK